LLVGIVGDTHNNLKNISEICKIFNEIKVDLVIHTGDITLPKALDRFKSLNMKLLGVFGNNDEGEKENLLEVSKEFDCKLFDAPYFLKLKGKKITILHDPLDINREILKSSDYIFHGHTHRYRFEEINEVKIFNPGECAGFLKGKNKVGLFDLIENKIKTINF
tara:strand:- start:34343 stop:34831 length:489 start_codon:yes stop_codon:yes gene_type:complete